MWPRSDNIWTGRWSVIWKLIHQKRIFEDKYLLNYWIILLSIYQYFMKGTDIFSQQLVAVSRIALHGISASAQFLTMSASFSFSFTVYDLDQILSNPSHYIHLHLITHQIIELFFYTYASSAKRRRDIHFWMSVTSSKFSRPKYLWLTNCKWICDILFFISQYTLWDYFSWDLDLNPLYK